MKIIDHIENRKSTLFSFEILPPLKGLGIQSIYNAIDPLLEFNPSFIDVTYHREDFVLKKRVDDYVFKLRDGTTSKHLNGTFRHLMRDSGLNRHGGNKTLYSLRHTYAHLAILEENMDVYSLSKQMGTSVKMIEQYYGHITPAHIASKLAGKRMVKRKITPKAK